MRAALAGTFAQAFPPWSAPHQSRIPLVVAAAVSAQYSFGPCNARRFLFRWRRGGCRRADTHVRLRRLILRPDRIGQPLAPTGLSDRVAAALNFLGLNVAFHA